jgi:hypothetical protein
MFTALGHFTSGLAIALTAMAFPLAACSSDPLADPLEETARSHKEETGPGSGESGKPGNDKDNQENKSMTVKITAGGKTFTAEIEDSETGNAFLAKLPLTLDMSELNGNEKYAYLDNPLPSDSRNPETIHAGDLMLFGSSCIGLFYQTFPTQYTYTPIAQLDDAEGLAECVGAGDVDAHIALA